MDDLLALKKKSEGVRAEVEGSRLCDVWEALRVMGDNVDESRRWWDGRSREELGRASIPGTSQQGKEGVFSSFSPASLRRISRTTGWAVPGVKVQNKSR